jgi:glycosyltransferase involved in cell wall biosynthesis
MIKNEIDGITELFNKIPFDKFDEVVAIDGMSNDGSEKFLKKKGINVITQTIDGRGQAFRDAFNNTDSDVLMGQMVMKILQILQGLFQRLKRIKMQE